LNSKLEKKERASTFETTIGYSSLPRHPADVEQKFPFVSLTLKIAPSLEKSDTIILPA
jgi:hypothetical protein